MNTLHDTAYLEAWIKWLEELARLKILKNETNGGETEITDTPLATAACEAIQKVSTMAYLRNIKELNFKKTSKNRARGT